jgi:hypothetical protein
LSPSPFYSLSLELAHLPDHLALSILQGIKRHDHHPKLTATSEVPAASLSLGGT